VLKFLLCTQDRKVEASHFDALHLMTSGHSAGSVGIGESVAEAVSHRIGVTLEYLSRRSIGDPC
jgi:hypothetical protein